MAIDARFRSRTCRGVFFLAFVLVLTGPAFFLVAVFRLTFCFVLVSMIHEFMVKQYLSRTLRGRQIFGAGRKRNKKCGRNGFMPSLVREKFASLPFGYIV